MEIKNDQDLQVWNTTTQTSKEVVLGAIDSLNNGDVEGWLAAFHDDFEFTIPGTSVLSGTKKGVKAFLDLIEEVAEHLETMITISLTNVIASGEWVVTQSDGRSVTKHGEDYNQKYCILFQVIDGKIMKYIEYHDTDLLKRVLLKP